MVERLIHRPRPNAMRDNRFLKRLRKKAKKGLRGWPLATIAFYGPNLSQATKAAVGIIPSEMQRRKRCATGMCFMVIFEKTSALAKK